MKITRIDTYTTFIIPTYGKTPTSGCYLFRDNDNIGVVYNGVKYLVHRQVIDSISVTNNKMYIRLNTTGIVDTLSAIQTCGQDI